jgi:hypothetical protein
MFRIFFWDVLPFKMIVAPLKRRSTIILHGSTSQKKILNEVLEMVTASIIRNQPDDGGSKRL